MELGDNSANSQFSLRPMMRPATARVDTHAIVYLFYAIKVTMNLICVAFRKAIAQLARRIATDRGVHVSHTIRSAVQR